MNKEYLRNIDKIKELNILFENDNTFTITLYNSLA